MIKIIRLLFILCCVIMGVLWASQIVDNVNDRLAATSVEKPPKQMDVLPWSILGGLTGAAISLVVIAALHFITQDVFEKLMPAVVSIVMGIVMGYGLVRYIIHFWPPADGTIAIFMYTSVILVFGFIGITLGLTKAASWETLVQAVHRKQMGATNPKLVDTSVLIDGRISDVCETGFVEGTLMIPRFVLKELQNIADSADVLRRARGRRGLDIIKALQQESKKVTIQVIEDDPESIPEVDGKLVRLARDYNAKIITNDLNLNKVAQIEGIGVLNLNDLANALKPAVLPDEHMHVKIVKEGKEAFQGVGYLDDGTMVVVDGGKDHVGRDVSVIVTSVLQTTAGRMIFTKLQSVLS